MKIGDFNHRFLGLFTRPGHHRHKTTESLVNSPRRHRLFGSRDRLRHAAQGQGGSIASQRATETETATLNLFFGGRSYGITPKIYYIIYMLSTLSLT